MHVVQRRQRTQKRMYLPSQRVAVNGVGLGDLEGMFNIGKMFTRMFTFTPSSFKLKNIAGAIGSVATTTASFGIANVVSEIAGPSGLKLTKGTLTSAHSKPMEYVGYGTMAAAAAAAAYVGGSALLSQGAGTAGATGTGLTSTAGTAAQGTGIGVASTGATTTGGFFSTVGSAISSVGSGLMKAMAALPLLGSVLGGGSGGQAQGGMTQAEYDAQQQAAYDKQQYDAAQAAYIAQQQQQMYQPGGMPVSYDMGQPSMTGPNAAYGDLRSPYTAIAPDGSEVQIDPMTGQVIPGMSMETKIGIGGIAFALAGLAYYYTLDSK